MSEDCILQFTDLVVTYIILTLNWVNLNDCCTRCRLLIWWLNRDHVYTVMCTNSLTYFTSKSEWTHQLYRIVLSELPDTTRRSRYCRHAIPRLCPLSVRINSLVTVLHTLMVRSPDADTMYLSSKSTTLTAARWPTRTRRRVMSIADCMSQTAIERSCTGS